MALLKLCYLLQILVVFTLGSFAANGKISARFQLIDCDGKDLDSVYDDAISLADNAIQWIDKLLGISFIIAPEDDRVARDAQIIFGVKRNALGLGISDEGKSRLTEAKGNYARVLAALKTGQDMELAEHFILCGDSNLQRTTNMADLGPVGGTQRDFEAMYGTSGVWYATNSKNFQGVPRVIFTSLSASKPPICQTGPGGSVVARVFHPTEPKDLDSSGIKKDGIDLGITKMVICEYMWDEEKLKSSIGDKAKDYGDGLNPDDIASRGGSFLHEMFHVLDPSPIGAIWADKVLNSRLVAYKFTGATKLAMEGHWDEIGTNPDNYRVFAEMAWASKTKWRGLKPAGSSKRAEMTDDEDLFEGISDTESSL